MSILAVGTFWFWTVIIASIILIAIFTNDDHNSSVGAIGTLIALFGALLLFGSRYEILKVLHKILSHQILTTLIIFVYLVFGVIWSGFKWYLFLLKKVKEDLKHYDEYATAPKVYTYKHLIIRWMCYWPFSVLWTTTHDLIKNIYTYIYDTIASTLQKMSDRVYKPVIAEQMNRKLQRIEKTDKKYEERTGGKKQ